MTDERQAGLTALITAYARAYHATHDTPKIFDDFLADQLYTPEEHLSFDYHLAELLKTMDPDLAAAQPNQAAALALLMQIHYGPVTLSRSRYCEDILDEAVRQGARQYVILGAGFDTFAFRRADLLARLQVYEVDHPVTQAQKQQRIAQAGWKVPENLHFVPIDFAREDLAAALGRSLYNPRQLSFFSWLGVSYYLAREVVFETLKATASLAAPGSTLVFDYFDAEAFLPGRATPRMKLMHTRAQMVGEPMKTGLDPAGLAADLAAVGFDLEENLDPEEIERRYFQGRADRYHAFDHVHIARAKAR